MHAQPKRGLRLTIADITLLALVFIWGVNYIVIKVSLKRFHPLVFNALRFLLATLSLLLIIKKSSRQKRLSRKVFCQAALLGILANTFYQLLFIEGLARTTVGHAALIQASMPVQVALLSHLTGRERMGWRAWLGLTLTFSGLALLLSFRWSIGLKKPTWQGDALMFAASLSWACYTILVEPVLTKAPAGQVTVVGFLFGTPLLVLIALPYIFQQDFRSITWASWGGVFFSGFLAIGLGYLTWNYAVTKLGATRTAAYANLIPVVAAVFAWVSLGETWHPLQLLGAATTLLGITITRFSRYWGRNEA